MSSKLSEVSKVLSDREKTAGTIWLIIGIVQCLSCIFIFVGAWNIYAATTRFKQSKAVLNPWQGIVATYDKWQTNLIINLVINLLFGGIIGVAGSIYDMTAVRGYVMSNRKVFEEAGL